MSRFIKPSKSARLFLIYNRSCPFCYKTALFLKKHITNYKIQIVSNVTGKAMRICAGWDCKKIEKDVHIFCFDKKTTIYSRAKCCFFLLSLKYKIFENIYFAFPRVCEWLYLMLKKVKKYL